MKLNNKYIIGTHIMFYEIDMVGEHIDSIINAVQDIDNPENVTVKLLLNKSEYFERINIEQLTDKPLHPRTLPDGSLNPVAFSEPYSISYTMSIEEMNDINDRADGAEILTLNAPKFDGSGLIISADLIKAGANIPLGIFGLAAEDTAFMYSCLQVLGNNYKQFIIKNILKVHNRQHPKKRRYALDMVEEQESTQRIKGDWYNKLRDMNKENLNIAFNNPQGKFLTYNDFIKEL